MSQRNTPSNLLLLWGPSPQEWHHHPPFSLSQRLRVILNSFLSKSLPFKPSQFNPSNHYQIQIHLDPYSRLLSPGHPHLHLDFAVASCQVSYLQHGPLQPIPHPVTNFLRVHIPAHHTPGPSQPKEPSWREKRERPIPLGFLVHAPTHPANSLLSVSLSIKLISSLFPVTCPFPCTGLWLPPACACACRDLLLQVTLMMPACVLMTPSLPLPSTASPDKLHGYTITPESEGSILCISGVVFSFLRS